MDSSVIQIAVTALLSSGVVGAIVTMVSKRVWSPEAKNELARIGNEFAQQLLEEARSEREELRSIIRELEANILVKDEAIRKLRRLADEKDTVIRILEERQFVVARKIQQGQIVTFYDIFGPRTPAEFLTGFIDTSNKDVDNG